jgi:hypothetical protein
MGGKNEGAAEMAQQACYIEQFSNILVRTFMGGGKCGI